MSIKLPKEKHNISFVNNILLKNIFERSCFIIKFLILHIYVCHVHECRCPGRLEEDVGVFRPGGTGGCESPDIGAEKQALVFERAVDSTPLIHEP